jgi:hypothetical protein
VLAGCWLGNGIAEVGDVVDGSMGRLVRDWVRGVDLGGRLNRGLCRDLGKRLRMSLFGG